jgi:hypothetical protein
MRGRRKVIETGLIGFKVKEAGLGPMIINNWYMHYINGDVFETDQQGNKVLNRWDDGFVLNHMMNTPMNKLNVKQHDIIPMAVKDPNVSRHSILRQYILHHKGLHGRGLGIMT